MLSGFSHEQDLEESGMTDEDSPVVRLVNRIIANAVAQRAGDIHFDPQETELKVRYRIDGVLRNERSLPKYMQNVSIGRIKVMSHLNINERHRPKDGRSKMHVNFTP